MRRPTIPSPTTMMLNDPPVEAPVAATHRAGEVCRPCRAPATPRRRRRRSPTPRAPSAGLSRAAQPLGRTGIEAGGTHVGEACHRRGRQTSCAHTRQPRQADAKNPLTSTSLGQSTGSVWPADTVGTYGSTETNPDRAPDFERRRAPPAPVEEDRPAGVRLGRDLVDRVRDRRDPGRAAAPSGDRGGRVRSAGADRDRRLRAAGDRGDLVPPDDHGVPVGRRRLHREPREPGRHAVARRRVGAAGRLHPDGVGQRRRWCAGDPHGHRLRHPVDRAGVPARVCSSSP